MFVRSALIALAVAAVFYSDVEAQLFRFGRNDNNSARSPYVLQPTGTSRYDASAYQYNNPPQRATYVPSQRSGDQSSYQRPPFPNSRDQQVAMQGNAKPQQAGTGQPYQMVAGTYRDPYTRRTFQRQYIIQGAAQIEKSPTPANQKPNTLAQKSRSTQSSENTSVQLSKANPIDIATPTGQDPTVSRIRRTSFDAPELTPQDESIEFSVFETIDDQDDSSIESALPILEPQAAASSARGSLEFNARDEPKTVRNRSKF